MDLKRIIGNFRQDPVFIVGYGRSGTTLLQLMLTAHPEISIAPEQENFALYDLKLTRETIWRSQYLSAVFADELGLHAALEASFQHQKELVYALYCLAWAKILGKKSDVRWGDKYTANWQFMPTLAQWYPRSQFIHIVRNPCDVISSIIQHFPKSIRIPTCLIPAHINLAWRWRNSYRATIQQGNLLGSHRYLMVQYENLVIEPRVYIKKVCEFLNINYMDEMVHSNSYVSKGLEIPCKETHCEVRYDPHPGRIGRFKGNLKPQQVGQIEYICKEEMQKIGYALSGKHVPAIRSLSLEILLAFFQLGWTGVRIIRGLTKGI